jgi:pyruvate-formate lyase
MSDIITIPRSEWKQLKEAIQTIASTAVADDLVNRAEAVKILGIDNATFSARRIKPDTVNEYGQKFYSRLRLKGLKKQAV